MNSPTGQTRLQIFTLDGSNDADSRKDVPFGGFVDIAPHFRAASMAPNLSRHWLCPHTERFQIAPGDRVELSAQTSKVLSQRDYMALE